MSIQCPIRKCLFKASFFLMGGIFKRINRFHESRGDFFQQEFVREIAFQSCIIRLSLTLTPLRIHYVSLYEF